MSRPRRRLRAIIMTRLSSYAGEKDTSSAPERQLEICESYCDAKDWEIVARIADLDVSASDKGLRLERPGLIQARALYDKADVLLVPKLDRLARNVADFAEINEEATAHSVAIVSVAESLDLTTPGGKFSATILAAFAEMEADTISQRTREAVAYMAREGRHRGGNAAWSHQIVARDNEKGYRLALHPDHAPVLYDVAQRVIAGEAADAICEDLLQRGEPGPGDLWNPRKGQTERGAAWRPDPLRKLLRNPILRGMQVHQGELVRDDAGLPIRPHDALVTDAEWEDLQRALAVGTTPLLADDAPNMLLRSRVVCLACGDRLHASTQENKPPMWVCSKKHHLPDGSKCPGAAIGRVLLEEHIVTETLARFGDVPGVEIIEERRADAELALVSEALDVCLAALRDVEDPEEEAVLMRRRRTLRARLTELQDAPVLVEASERPTGSTFGKDFRAADDAGKATLLRSVLAFVAVNKGTKGRRGLDVSRLTPVWKPSRTTHDGSVRPGVIYRVTA